MTTVEQLRELFCREVDMMLPKTYVYDTIERNRRLVPFPDQAQFVIGDAIKQYGEPGNAFVDAGSVLNIELPWGITARVDGLSREEAEHWGGELKLQIMRDRERSYHENG